MKGSRKLIIALAYFGTCLALSRMVMCEQLAGIILAMSTGVAAIIYGNVMEHKHTNGR